MSARANTYYICPQCGRKRVTLRLRSRGEDHYACDRCDFWVFSVEEDTEAYRTLAKINRFEEV